MFCLKVYYLADAKVDQFSYSIIIEIAEEMKWESIRNRFAMNLGEMLKTLNETILRNSETATHANFVSPLWSKLWIDKKIGLLWHSQDSEF